ncbi:MAG: hypothetical protein GY818_02255 [Planctomycetaceae bacterium]|nr:hypothetical protein [Planctomycetaceae bacterium]
MSLFGWLTGNSETAKTVVDSVVDAGDALFYTDEEKARDYTSYREWYLKYLEASQPQNVSRRIIAVIVTALWSLAIVAGVVAQGFGFSDFSTYIFNMLSENINTPFSVIVGFYFLKHIVSANKK